MDEAEYLHKRLPCGRIVVLAAAAFTFFSGVFLHAMDLFQRLSGKATPPPVAAAPATPPAAAAPIVSIILNFGSESGTKRNGPAEPSARPAPPASKEESTPSPSIDEDEDPTPTVRRPTPRPPVRPSPRKVDLSEESRFREAAPDTPSPTADAVPEGPVTVRVVAGVSRYRSYGQLWEDVVLTFTPEGGSKLPPVKVGLSRWSSTEPKFTLPRPGSYTVSMKAVSEIYRQGPSVKVCGGGSSKVVIREGCRLSLEREISRAFHDYKISAEIE